MIKVYDAKEYQEKLDAEKGKVDTPDVSVPAVDEKSSPKKSPKKGKQSE